MSVELFQVSFSGQIIEGADLDEVKSKLGGLLKANDRQITRLFSGNPVIIKKDLDKNKAKTYLLAFKKAGAICAVIPMSLNPLAAQAAIQPGSAVEKARPVSKNMPNTASKVETDSIKNSVNEEAATVTPNRSTMNTNASVSAVDRSKVASSRSGSRVVVSIAISVVVLVIIVLAIPFLTGMQAEAQYRASIAELQNSSAVRSSPIDIDINYQRGWFNSKATNTITLLNPEQDDIVIVLNSDIRHGPVFFEGNDKFGLASIESRIPLDDELKADAAKIWKDNPDPVRISSIVDFSGNSTTKISVDGFTLNDVENNPTSTVTSSDLLISFTLSENFSHLLATIDWDGMSVVTAESKFLVFEMAGYSEKSLLLESLWLGEDEFSIAEIAVNPGAAASAIMGEDFTRVNLESLNLSAHTEADSNNFVRGITTITIDNIVVKDKSVASQFELTIEVDNLPAEPLQAITTTIAEFQNKSGTTNQKPDLNYFQDDLGKILVAGPILKIRSLQADTEHGRVLASLDATIKVDDPSLIQNPIFLLLAVNASSEISVPVSLIEKTPLAGYLSSFQQQGYLILENGHLKTSIKFLQGQLTVNGKAFKM